MAGQDKKVIDYRHPTYETRVLDWEKWRLTAEGGDPFIDEYVEKFSEREGDTEFTNRKELTPCPAFAKAAMNDVKNSIFQRTTDITRTGGPQTYQDAILGLNGGVDLSGSSMNSYIGNAVLPELLTLAKVGVYVDMPIVKPGLTKAETFGIKPYLYTYKAEDILNWAYDARHELKAVLLRDTYNATDETGLITGEETRFRLLFIDESGVVNCRFYDSEGAILEEYTLEITRIPLVILEISNSILADIANHQIALVNLASSDIAYALKCNFPFYVEQYDPRAISPYLKQPSDSDIDTGAKVSDSNITTKVGTTTGRRYPIGTDQPAFIHPSAEPLNASMSKQQQLKLEIRELLNLAISNLQPKMASAESKSIDMQGLEAGLSYIGLELENGERRIATLWAEYENTEAATVNYPEKYSLRSDADRRKEAEELESRIDNCVSLTMRKALMKQIADILIGSKVSIQQLKSIYAEIDAATVIVSAKQVLSDLEAGIVDYETASRSRLYPDGIITQAKKDQAERLALIAEAQGGINSVKAGDLTARGVKMPGADPNASSKEKQNKQQRGPGK